MMVIIQKPDLDTCLTGLIYGLDRHRDTLNIVSSEAKPEWLDNPEILCIEAGGSGDVQNSNFDHHNVEDPLPPACYQALKRKGDPNDPILNRLVNYVCQVDEGQKICPAIPYPSLSNVFSGMRLVEKSLFSQFWSGIDMLHLVYSLGLDPFARLKVPETWEHYMHAKENNFRQVQAVIHKTLYITSKSGMKIGFLEHPGIGGIGALFNQGCDIAVVFSTAFGYPPRAKWTIAGKICKLDALKMYFCTIEPGWGGTGTIIGSPRMGTHLGRSFILAKIKEFL